MLTLCPHCGHHLPRPLLDGITSCRNCLRTFDSTRINKLLSIAWVIRKKNITEPDYYVYRHGVSREDAEFVLDFVDQGCGSHDELLLHLKQLRLHEYSEKRLDLAS